MPKVYIRRTYEESFNVNDIQAEYLIELSKRAPIDAAAEQDLLDWFQVNETGLTELDRTRARLVK